eukprot:scaffold118060_cov45-Attheya_sp.AAC.1
MTPLELLASYHRADDDDVDDESASAEDSISQVFSSLVVSLLSSSQHGAPLFVCAKEEDTTNNNATTVLEDITWRLGFHHNVSLDDREDEQQQQQPTTEWNAALELIRLHLFKVESPPSPRELLRTVVFDPYFVDVDVDVDVDVHSLTHNDGQERITNNGRVWCNVLGVLLVCHAVQSATRRVDSMRMEAIAFYQRHCLLDQSFNASLFISSSSSTTTTTMMSHTLDIYWHLFFQYLVPSVLLPSSSQQAQHDTGAILIIDPPSSLVACGVVRTLLDLVEMTTTS